MEIIVGKNSGFCNGVKRSVTCALKELEKRGDKIYSLGQIVHNASVSEELKEKGLEVIQDIEEVKESQAVIFRAHGVKKNTYLYCEKNGVSYIDLTCPNVLRIHEMIQSYHEKGYMILLVGDPHHPENIGSVSFAKNFIHIIEDALKLDFLIKEMIDNHIEKCLLLSQTTCSLKKFLEIKDALIKKLPKNISLEVKDTICRATEIRQNETEQLAKEVDAMIIIGGKNSSNTKVLYEISKSFCKLAFWIESFEELDFNDLKACQKVGIMAGASTPLKKVEEVIKILDTTLG